MVQFLVTVHKMFKNRFFLRNLKDKAGFSYGQASYLILSAMNDDLTKMCH